MALIFTNLLSVQPLGVLIIHIITLKASFQENEMTISSLKLLKTYIKKHKGRFYRHADIFGMLILRFYSLLHKNIMNYTEQNIEDIYFFEVNNKYISSNVLKKITVISRVRSTKEIADIFNT